MVVVIAQSNHSKEFPIKKINFNLLFFLFSSRTDHHGSQSETNLKDKPSTAVYQCNGRGNISIYVESTQAEVTIPCQPCVVEIQLYTYVCI